MVQNNIYNLTNPPIGTRGLQMGLFVRLFGKSESVIPEPNELRDALFGAARAGDIRRVERLGRANLVSVLEHFRAWQRVPDAIRTDSAAMQNYVQVLVTIAQLFAEKFSRPELMNALIGTAESNPLIRWQESLKQAREMMDRLAYDSARSLLTDVLIDSRGLQGSGHDQLLPVTNGFVGECHFQAGEVEQSIPHFEQALVLCERTNDTDGVVAYLGSLFEANRYLGNSPKAAGLADQLAHLPGQIVAAHEQKRWHTRARIVRSGEPLNRVVGNINNESLELYEIEPKENLHVSFVFERNRIALRPAEVLTERGEKLGSAGRLDEALAIFQEATRADAFDPHSRYLEAFTLLCLGQHALAAERYRQVEELAPGWFHCRADAWLAEQLVLGPLDQADFIAVHGLEDGPESPDKKIGLAQRLIAKRPGLAVAYMHLGKNLSRVGREMEARKALQAGLDANSDPDVRTRLLVEMGVLTTDRKERESILQEALALNGNLIAGASAALALRAMT
jgi:tetratricopeptide (TPR) repeat protein